ncbi:MAG: hypothetical protein DRN53_03055 [Thermoprotei archaeon]|nr:MAG: hypothetical protein DRN53_03055 [Thermoprotei archaeon]
MSEEFDRYKAICMIAKHRLIHMYDIAFALDRDITTIERILHRLEALGIVSMDGLFVEYIEEVEEGKEDWWIMVSTIDPEYYTQRGFIKVGNVVVAPFSPALSKLVRASDMSFTGTSEAAEKEWYTSYGGLTPIKYMMEAERILVQAIKTREREGRGDIKLLEKACKELKKASIIARERYVPPERELTLDISMEGGFEDILRLVKQYFKSKELEIVKSVLSRIRGVGFTPEQ